VLFAVALLPCGRTYAADTNPATDLSSFLSTFYPDPGAKNPAKTNLVQAIVVTSPAYCSSIKGDTTISFKAPGMAIVHALCWQQPTAADPSPWGHDADLAPGLKLDAGGAGSFVFHSDQFPNGPMNLRLYARDSGTNQDICELQLYNEGGVIWNQGIPKTDPPAAQGMKLAFADDFDGPLSIAKDDSGRYWTHWAGGDNTAWGFGENEGPRNPFSQVGTFLRIHATKPPGMKGVTGSLCSVHKDRTGITVTAPCYFECRLLAQNAPGTWPAFWVTTNSTDPKMGCDEMDVIEGYGTSAKSHSGLWTMYHATTHFWGQPQPDWNTKKGPDGKPKPFKPASATPKTMTLGGKSSWSTTFHTYGLLITQQETVYYFDNIEIVRHPTGKVAGTLPMNFFVNLAFGGGWPVDLQRYGNQSDMWVDYVRLYQGAR